jgi:hypothetical protein
VIPVADDLASATERAVDRQRQPDGEPMHAAAGAARFVPSTMKCPWSCWIEKWITRKRSTDARAMARRRAPKTRDERSDGSPGAARIVIWTGHRGSSFGRVV